MDRKNNLEGMTNEELIKFAQSSAFNPDHYTTHPKRFSLYLYSGKFPTGTHGASSSQNEQERARKEAQRRELEKEQIKLQQEQIERASDFTKQAETEVRMMQATQKTILAQTELVHQITTQSSITSEDLQKAEQAIKEITPQLTIARAATARAVTYASSAQKIASQISAAQSFAQRASTAKREAQTILEQVLKTQDNAKKDIKQAEATLRKQKGDQAATEITHLSQQLTSSPMINSPDLYYRIAVQYETLVKEAEPSAPTEKLEELNSLVHYYYSLAAEANVLEAQLRLAELQITAQDHRKASYWLDAIKKQSVLPLTIEQQKTYDTLAQAVLSSQFSSLILSKSKKEIEKQVDLNTSADNLIGKGGFGAVYKVKKKQYGGNLALKQFSIDSTQKANLAIAEKEVAALEKLNGLYIIGFYGYCSEQEGSSYLKLSLLLELAHGSLDKLLLDKTKNLSWSLRIQFAYEIVSSLVELHKLDLMHGDLKPQNILIGNDWHLRLSDFGLTDTKNTYYTTAKTSTSDLGFTILWEAPETFSGIKKGKASDMFSYALMVFSLAAREMPIVNMPAAAIIGLRLSNTEKSQLTARFPPETSPIFTTLFDLCYQQKPEARLSSEQAINEISIKRLPIPPKELKTFCNNIN